MCLCPHFSSFWKMLCSASWSGFYGPTHLAERVRWEFELLTALDWQLRSPWKFLCDSIKCPWNGGMLKCHCLMKKIIFSPLYVLNLSWSYIRSHSSQNKYFLVSTLTPYTVILEKIIFCLFLKYKGVLKQISYLTKNEHCCICLKKPST